MPEWAGGSRAHSMDFSKSFSVFNSVPAFASKSLPLPASALSRLGVSVPLSALAIYCTPTRPRILVTWPRR